MKLLLALILLSNVSQAAETPVAKDDLILQSRIDPTSMSWLVDKTRLIMNNSDIKDGLTDTIPLEDTIFTMAELSTDPNFIKLQEIAGKIFGMNMKGAVLRLRIPKLFYQVRNLKVSPKKLEILDPNLELTTGVDIQGVDIGLTEGVQLDFMLENPKSKKLESYFTASVEPSSVKIPETIAPANFEVDFITKRDQKFNFILKGYNLDRLPIYVEEHLSDIIQMANSTGKPITADQIKVNPVIVKVNQLTRSIQFDDFKPLVQKKLNDILKTVFKTVGRSLKNTIGPNILKSVFSLETRSDLIVSNANLYTRFATAEFFQPNIDQLALGVTGDLCTNELYQHYQMDCTSHMEPMPPVRTLTTETHDLAKVELKEKIASGQADVGFSISEEYLNRLLKTTINANLWDDLLKENHLKIGPKGVFVIFVKAKINPELYLDLYYTGEKGITSILINERRPIHFPLRMSTDLKFEVRKAVPYLVIKTEKLLSNSNEIINGIPEYGMESRLVWGLKKKIAKMVIEMAKKLEGKSALDMEIPVFQGLGLEKTWYETSQYGRINLYFKL